VSQLFSRQLLPEGEPALEAKALVGLAATQAARPPRTYVKRGSQAVGAML